jgi:hypothetical protein
MIPCVPNSYKKLNELNTYRQRILTDLADLHGNYLHQDFMVEDIELKNEHLTSWHVKVSGSRK